MSRELNYLTYFSPLKGTAFEQLVTFATHPAGTKVCLAEPIQKIAASADTVMQTYRCPSVDRFVKHRLEEGGAVTRLESQIKDAVSRNDLATLK